MRGLTICSQESEGRRKMRSLHLALLVILLCAKNVEAAVVYDASAQFDKNSNPSTLGPRAYGFYSTSLGAGFTLYDKHFDSASTGGTGNVWDLLSDCDGLPQVAYNPNAVNI